MRVGRQGGPFSDLCTASEVTCYIACSGRTADAKVNFNLEEFSVPSIKLSGSKL